MKEKTRKRRGPSKRPARVHIGMRVPPHVLDFYGGKVWRMRDAIVAYTEEQIANQNPPCQANHPVSIFPKEQTK
jgi:hypothetical protein